MLTQLAWAVMAGGMVYLIGTLLRHDRLVRYPLRYLPDSWREQCLLQLWRAGAQENDERLLGRLIWVDALALSLTFLLPSPFNWVPLLLLLLSFTLFWQHLKNRQEQVKVELINMAGTLSLAVSDGQDFTVALSYYVGKEQGLLSESCLDALSRLRLGQARDSVFESAVKRYPVTRDFFTALNMSQRQGTPLAQTLKDQAARLRQGRLFQAEARAQKLPVLMMGPLALCIFPNVFLALLGPYLLEIL